MATLKDTIINLQYQYSKLFNIGLNRKQFVITSTEDKLFAMNTSKNTFLALLFTLLASGHLTSGIAVGLSSTEKLGSDFYVAFSLLFIIGLIGFRQFLWLTNGRQELTVEQGTLTLCKKGTFLTKLKTYELAKIEKIRQGFDEDDLTLFEKTIKNIEVNKKVIFSHIFGQVLFDYQGKTIKIFCDLDGAERLELINEITKRK